MAKVSGFLRHAAWLFSGLIAVLCGPVIAETKQPLAGSAAACPADFSVVDLGIWTPRNGADAVFGYGGLLYRLSPERKDHARCLSSATLDAGTQMLEGRPVPLVTHVIDQDIGRRFLQRPSGDVVEDAVAGWNRQYPSPSDAVAATEAQNRAEFTRWLRAAADNGQAIAKGAGFACLYDPENPELSENGDYACLVTVPGAPNPDTLFSCGRWIGGCFAEFSLASGVSIRLTPETLPHWPEAARMNSIPKAVTFWSDLITASIRNFEENIVPRDGVTMQLEQ